MEEQKITQLPQYVEQMLRRRLKVANKLIDACVAVDDYCEKIGIPTNDGEACLCTDVMIYCEPWTAYAKTREAILKQLNKNHLDNQNKETEQ